MLSIALPCAVDGERCAVKLSRKRRTLTVTMPTVEDPALETTTDDERPPPVRDTPPQLNRTPCTPQPSCSYGPSTLALSAHSKETETLAPKFQLPIPRCAVHGCARSAL